MSQRAGRHKTLLHNRDGARGGAPRRNNEGAGNTRAVPWLRALRHTPKGGSSVRDVIIIGPGPAAWTAAIYTARANLKPVVVASQVEVGGELMNTTEVE